MKPLVTVYLVNHNYSKYILQAFYSILYQSYKNIEILIIDNCSSDNSREIINSIKLITPKNSNIKFFFREKSDLISSCNYAISKANGKFLVRLDADDYFIKDAIEKLVSVFLKNKNIDLVYSDYYEVTKYNNLIRKITHINYEREIRLPTSPAHGACTMFRISKLKKVGGYNESFDRQDGYYIWITFIIKKFKIKNINKPLFCYRIHGKNLTTDNSKLLEVRSNISINLLEKYKVNRPKIDCIIPLRYHNLNENKLKIVINNLLDSKVFDNIIILSSDLNIKKQIKNNSRIKFIDRKFSGENHQINLGFFLSNILKKFYEQKQKPDSIFVRTLNIPNIKSHYFKQMLFISSLFRKVDSIVGVTESNDSFYKFNGKSLYPINNENYVYFEREKIYKKVRGFTLVKYKQLIKNKVLVSGIVSPLVISDNDAIEEKLI